MTARLEQLSESRTHNNHRDWTLSLSHRPAGAGRVAVVPRWRQTMRKLLSSSKLMPCPPCLVVDLDQVAQNYRLCLYSSRFTIFYAIKANPAQKSLTFGAARVRFDAASLTEVRQALAAGAKAETISFGSTIKRSSEIAASHALGKTFCLRLPG